MMGSLSPPSGNQQVPATEGSALKLLFLPSHYTLEHQLTLLEETVPLIQLPSELNAFAGDNEESS